MPDKRQNMVNNIEPPGGSASGGAGAIGRDDATLRACFPFSPLYHTEVPPADTDGPPVAGGGTEASGFDTQSKEFYLNEVLNGDRPTGFGIDNFSPDFIDAPNFQLLNTDTQGRSLAESIAIGVSVGDPLNPWPMPKPSNHGIDTPETYTFSNLDAGYGSGPGGVSASGNPAWSSERMSEGDPLSPTPEGTSATTSLAGETP